MYNVMYIVVQLTKNMCREMDGESGQTCQDTSHASKYLNLDVFFLTTRRSMYYAYILKVSMYDIDRFVRNIDVRY